MSNPFRDWTPEMVDKFNRRLVSRGAKPLDNPQDKSSAAEAFGKKFESLAVKPTKRKPLLNKTEARFLARLQLMNPGKSIGIQSITLKLAWDCRYTPDFWIHVATGELRFYEVKGAFIREDGMVKLKAAAAAYPTFEFVLAQWKDGQWTTKAIPPL